MNSPIPALPLTKEGALILDNSTIELLRCPRLLYYKWLRRRAYVPSKAGRNFGSALHVGWAIRYRQCGNKKVPTEHYLYQVDEMDKFFKSSPAPEGDFRDFSHACTVMTAYNEHYGDEPFEILKQPAHCKNPDKPMVEEPFLLPFGKVFGVPIFYAGKIDLVIQDQHGIWSQDHKTTFQFGETFDKQLAQDGGQMGYVWALSRILGVKPQGFIIDAVRVRRPKAGSEYSMTPPVDATDFKRWPRWVTNDDLNEWYEDTLQLVSDILWYHHQQNFPRHRWQCTNKFGTCDFYDVCSMPAEQREHVLAQDALYEDDKWTPLNPPEAKRKYRQLQVGEAILPGDLSLHKTFPDQSDKNIEEFNSVWSVTGAVVGEHDGNYYYRKET